MEDVTPKHFKKEKKYWLKIKIGMYVIIPIFILILPADFFDEGESICISTIVFNTTCYGCGMTKAVMHFIHLDFQKAIAYHKLVVVVVPLLIYSWGASLLKLYKRVVYKL